MKWYCFKRREDIIQSKIDELTELWQDLADAYLKEHRFEYMDILINHMSATHRAISRCHKLKINKHDTQS